MKKYIMLFLSVTQILRCSSTWVQQEKYTIEYEDDGKEKPIAFYFQQECNIDNEQKVTYNHPITPPLPPEPVVTPVSSWFSLTDIFMPLKVSVVGAFLFGLYYVKTKINLYSLSKACIQTAFWSLWQLKNKNDLILNQSQDTALLYDILQTYHTDQYAVAISRFLQDVDTEIGTLHHYIQEASDVKVSLIKFLLPDMNNDILEAQARLARLTYLKQKVMNWLAQEQTKHIQKWN